MWLFISEQIDKSSRKRLLNENYWDTVRDRQESCGEEKKNCYDISCEIMYYYDYWVSVLMAFPKTVLFLF